MTDTANHCRIAQNLIEQVWNRGDSAFLDTMIAPDYVDTAYAPPNAEGHKAMVERLKSVIPDARWSVISIVADDTSVVFELRLNGTHRGEFRGIAPAGNAIDIVGYRHFTFRNGKLVRHAALLDTAGLLRQMKGEQAA